ncbi:unnamed protein product [Hydatigera taeniaeformis]|uniref:YLP motif-containing protein 1 n=1 Tax=Hydatigena taeniaeformis TaxID=6205 RepID=A0A0R3X3C8_HYDTA|nr:unnamed protein product [Hydatigera taeniaeformis]
MQNSYTPYPPRGVPQNNPRTGFYPSTQPTGPRFYSWQYGPPVYENTSNCYLATDFQRPPCQAFSGTRSSGVPHPVHYPNFNVPPCGDYPNPQLDKDYRQSSGREFEQSCMEHQNLFNSDQGTYYSQSYNEGLSDSRHSNDFHADDVGSSSWEPQIRFSGPPRDQDWRSSQPGLEPQASSWGSGTPYYNYGYHQGDRYQNGRERCVNQFQCRERSRSPPTSRDLDYNQQFWCRSGASERLPSSGYIDPSHRIPSTVSSQRPLFAVAQSTTSQRIASETLLMNPGRKSRPPKILVILRGLPGSGKSTLAKLIKEKEAKAAEDEGKSAAVRVLSMDDFFINEEGRFVYEADMDEVYRKQLVKLLSRQMDNGLFNFLLIDAVNRSAAELEELAIQARSRHFQVYVIEVNTSLTICLSRSAGRRSESDVRAIFAAWEPTPSRYTIIDANSLQQEITAEEVDMEADSGTEEGVSPLSSPAPAHSGPGTREEDHNKAGNEKDSDEDDDEDISRGAWGLLKSKWDDDASFQRLERLDGLKRKLHHSNSSSTLSMAEYLKDDASQFRRRKEGVKRVTWADIEALRENSRMRELGFVVGQTDWSRMTEENDAKIASQALTRTKYF